MNTQKAFSDTFDQSILGVVIGWGGFSTLIPNLLGSASQAMEMGSFMALRIFSIVFFLAPLFLAVIYWWARGAKFYFKHVFGVEAPHPAGYNLLLMFFLVANLLPIALFLYNPLFLYATFSFSIGIEAIIIWYFLLAIIQYWYFIYSFRIGQSRFARSVFLIFSVQFVFGIGLAGFIEPWMIYKESMGWLLILLFFLYIVSAVIGYLKYNNSGQNSLQKFKHFGISILVLALLISNFPLLSYDSKWGLIGLIATTIVLACTVLFLIKTPSGFSGRVTIGVGLTLVSAVFICVHCFFLKDDIFKDNQYYFESRRDAVSQIGKDKVFPFIFQKKGWISSKYNLDSAKCSPDLLLVSREVVHQNIELAAYRNHRTFEDSAKMLVIDTASFKLELDLDSLLTNHPEAGVRSVFYSNYLKLNSQKVDKDKKLEKQDSIRKFYAEVYDHIEKEIICQYFVPLYKETKTTDWGHLNSYKHPINYYTETLRHYKGQYDTAKLVERLADERILADSLSSLDSMVYKARNDTLELKVLNNLNKIPEFKHFQKGDDHLVYLWNKKTDKNGKETFGMPRFKYITQLKGQQYYERYGRAQTIFRAYLVDCQRIGLFVLFFTSVVFLLMYWIQSGNAAKPKPFDMRLHPQKNDKPSPLDESPQGFLRIGILVMIILLIHIARPIQKEHINPEKPYWMMDLGNWYAPDPLDRLIGKEDPVKKVEYKYGGDHNSQTNIEIESLLKELTKGNNRRIGQLDSIKKKL